MNESNEKIKEVWAQIKAVSGAKKIVGNVAKNTLEVTKELKTPPQNDGGLHKMLGKGLLD